jgi:hypothetical protein
MVTERGGDPDTWENMRLGRLFTYAEFVAVLDKERRIQAGISR